MSGIDKHREGKRDGIYACAGVDGYIHMHPSFSYYFELNLAEKLDRETDEFVEKVREFIKEIASIDSSPSS